MRALAVIDLAPHERSGQDTEQLRFPTNEELTKTFKQSSYALTDARHLAGQPLLEYYRQKAKPVFDTAPPTLRGVRRPETYCAVFYP